jgi:hypothetical protein
MAGSGSTVFGLFQKRRDAIVALDRLKGSGWRVLLTESLDRGGYARRAKARTVATPHPARERSRVGGSARRLARLVAEPAKSRLH